MSSYIQINDLNKTFKLTRKQRKTMGLQQEKLQVVKNLNINIDKGEIFGILGPNGAGKTTTLRMMATLIKPDSGDIIINNRSVVCNPKEVREEIGFLTSELKLDDVFTPDYLFDFYSNLYGISDSQERKEYLFKKFEIEKFATTKIGNLSTGNKQKVSLIISLVNDPDVIIFDEPTNGLDILAAKIVTDFLKEQCDKGKTIIISSHIFSLIEELCDRVAILIDGDMKLCCDKKEWENTSLEEVFFDLYDEHEENKK